MPTFNSSRFLRQALDSLLEQTYPNIELIVSDNASTDETPEILKEYSAKSTIRLLLNSENIGAGGNFNRLVQAARGDYIAIYHADDIYSPTIVADSVARFTTNPSLGLVGTLALVIDEQGSVTGRYHLPASLVGNGDGNFSFDDAFSGVLLTKGDQIFFVTSSIMVRRAVYLQVGYFDQQTYKSSVDYEMWLRIAHKFPVTVISEPLMSYRIHGNQGSQTEVRTNSSLPDILAVILSYRPLLEDNRIINLCAATIDRIYVKTALKQNYRREFRGSSRLASEVKSLRYAMPSVLIRLANRLKIPLGVWP